MAVRAITVMRNKRFMGMDLVAGIGKWTAIEGRFILA